MSSLPKPPLRGHLKRFGFKMLGVSFLSAGMAASLYHFLVAVPKQRAYENFLQTYDSNAHFQDLKKWGYLKGYAAAKAQQKD